MRNTFRVLFYVNGSKEKNGAVPIMGRVTVNGQTARFSCKLSVSLSLWNAKGNRAKGKSKEAQEINHAFDKIKARIIELYNQIRERENFVTDRRDGAQRLSRHRQRVRMSPHGR